MPIKIQKIFRTLKTLDQKRNFPPHIIIKTLNMQNKERILKVAREKNQVTYTGRCFSVETLNTRKA